MKRKLTFFVFLTIALTGCASLNGPKKPPRCNGKHTRILNRDKWDWDNKNFILQEKIVRPVTTPVILNTLESEKATADVILKEAPLNPINHKTLFDKTVEATREK
ncbi:type IV secretion system protein VirB7 [Bartonella refiksaydamii]|uniref:type IV secretion system protein VirB7 n=1 Tax=Bartonella refiksaydamii TaxID=2654951 RepID=UPI0012EB377D|nr:type IV secretion system protein VirB7 [Bartonella refiksaydamii]